MFPLLLPLNLEVRCMLSSLVPRLHASCCGAWLFSLLILWTTIAAAATHQVGLTRTLKTPCAAAPLVADNDTVEIDAGVYPLGACAWVKNGLTLRGVGGRPTITGPAVEGKALFLLKGSGITLESLAFVGAAGNDGNIAGVRTEGVNYTFRDSLFQHGQNGILTGGALLAPGNNGTVLVERCEFAGNGVGDGQTHNTYFARGDMVIFQHNWSHDSKNGQLFKSRAAVNHVRYNRFGDRRYGNSNLEIDLSEGGIAYVVGNIVHQGESTSNSSMLTFRPETPKTNTVHELYVINNTFVSERNATIFMQVRGELAKQVILNNVLVGKGDALFVNQMKTPLPANNLHTQTPGFLDVASHNYRLTASSLAVDKGVDPGVANGVSLVPAFQHVLPTGSQPRPVVGTALDMGAYELGVTLPTTSAFVPPVLSSRAVDNGILLSWTPAIREAAAVVSYDLRRNGQGVATIAAPSFTYTDSGLPQGVPQTYTLIARDSTGAVSLPSNMITKAVPRRVTGLPIPSDPGWYQLVGTKIAPVCWNTTNPGQKAPGVIGCSGVIIAENSGAYDTQRQRMVHWGGGHADYAGNEVYVSTLSPFGAERLTAPFLPPTPSKDANPDGTPTARHTHDATHYLPWLDSFFLGPSGSVWPGGILWPKDVWLLNLSSLRWRHLDMTGTRPIDNIVTSIPDPVTKLIYTHDGRCLRSINPETLAWTNVGCFATGAFNPHTVTSVIDPERRKLYIFGTRDVRREFDLPPLAYAVRTIPAPTWPSVYFPGLVYDTMRKRVVAYPGYGDTVWTMDPLTYIWTPYGFPGSPPLPSINGVYKRWGYDPALDVFIYAARIEQDLYAFRLPTSGTVPPIDPPPVEPPPIDPPPVEPPVPLTIPVPEGTKNLTIIFD
jgi:hypothetical protein